MSGRVIRNMNTLYLDATTEELAATDNFCIICCKKLPYNHIFHTACLRSWFQCQQICPTCRLNTLRPTPNNASSRQQNPLQPGPQIPLQSQQAPGVNPIGSPFHFPIFWARLPAPGMLQLQQHQQQAPNNAGIPLPPILVSLPNLIELSEEELRAMEGNLRQAVQAKIQTLIPVNNNSASNIDSTSDMSTMSKPGTNGMQTLENLLFPSTSKETASTTSILKEDTSTSNDTTDLSKTESSSEQEMLRRRRLQKFASPSTTE
ncbi:hypothetical protein P5V15_000867 [Pogonomyrmex californicus]